MKIDTGHVEEVVKIVQPAYSKNYIADVILKSIDKYFKVSSNTNASNSTNNNNHTSTNPTSSLNTNQIGSKTPNMKSKKNSIHGQGIQIMKPY